MEVVQIDDFIEQILTEKGITNIEIDVRNKLKEDMKSRLLQQINTAAIMQLSEKQAEELTVLIDDPAFTNEEFTAFMLRSGVNLLEVTLDTMLKFREFYLG